MQSTPKAILERGQSLPEGAVLAPKEFLHLGSRAAVDQAFCRLVRAGQLIRVARGTYVVPIRIKGSAQAPSAELVVRSMAAQGKQRIAKGGACAARSLGLTRAASSQVEYLTTGRNRQLSIGNRSVTFKHAPNWMFTLGATRAGDALRALAWVGEKKAQATAVAIRKRLARDEWESLSSVRASLPNWIAAALGKATISVELH